jgi:hypothetical protein
VVTDTDTDSDYLIAVILETAECGLRDSTPELDPHAEMPASPLGRLVNARIALRAIIHTIEAKINRDKKAADEEVAAGYHGVPLEVLSDYELASVVVPCEIEP